MTTGTAPGGSSEAVLVLPSFGSGGAERVVLNLAEGLTAAGRVVRLVVLDGRGPLREHVAAGVEVVDLGRPRARSAGPALLAHLRRRPADLVIGSQTHLNVLLALLLPLLPSRTRLVLREPTLHPGAARPAARDRALGRALGRADLVIASSPAMRDHLVGTVRGRARTLLIPNPVAVARLRSHVDGPGPAHRASEGPRLAVVGRLMPVKGHEELLRAVAHAGGTATLTVVGDGPLRASLEALSTGLGLGDRVRFAGRIDDPAALAAIVADADLLVHPSHFEGMPNAVLEALALGTPVLATTDLTVLRALADEVGPDALRLVPRAELASALAAVRPRADGPRPSLLPDRFDVALVVRSLLAALEDPRTRPGA